MKGLLIKDLLQLKSYKKNFIISIIVYGAIILMNSKESSIFSMGAPMIMFLFSVYAMASFSYDEKSNTDKYVLTFPLTRKEIVLSKYFLGILCILFGAFIGVIFSIVLSLIGINSIPNLNDLLITTLGSIWILSIMQSVQIPCIYKFGAEKGRFQIYIFMMILALFIGGFFIVFPNIDFSFIDRFTNLVPIVLLIFIVVNYLVSYKISYKIYLKKEA